MSWIRAVSVNPDNVKGKRHEIIDKRFFLSKCRSYSIAKFETAPCGKEQDHDNSLRQGTVSGDFLPSFSSFKQPYIGSSLPISGRHWAKEANFFFQLKNSLFCIVYNTDIIFRIFFASVFFVIKVFFLHETSSILRYLAFLLHKIIMRCSVLYIYIRTRSHTAYHVRKTYIMIM
jgi:hypothetical protein